MSAEAEAIRDYAGGLARANAWSLLAWDDIRSRYRRTTLGPLWLTLSHGIFLTGLALSFSIILKQPLGSYFVYLAAGMTIWVFIANSLNEAPAIFQRGRNLMFSYDLPGSIHIFRAVFSQSITFAHQMLIYIGALVFVSNVTNVYTLWAIPAVVVLVLAAIGWSTILSLLGARYHDLAPAIAAVTQMLFVLTPIFWQRAHLNNAQWIAEINPLYHLIEILRAPLLGQPPDPLNWIVALSLTGLLLIGGVALYARMRSQLIYWL